MTRKIFKSILSVAVAVLLASLVIITGVLYQYFGNIQQLQLKDELRLAAGAVDQLGIGYLMDMDTTRFRLTWIDKNGTVLFDSHADVNTMENHADREEIEEALLYGSGSGVRVSATLTEQTIYEAIRLNDGTVLRISVSRATATALLQGMIWPILFIMIFAVVVSILLARRMSMRIVEPLNRLDLEHPIENKAYEELSPLLHRIHTQHLEIESQIQILKHKQDEFDQITENMKEALILLDHAGRILSMNPAARTLFHVDDTCIGEVFLTIDRTQDMRMAINEAKEQGNSHFRATKTGREYQFDLNCIDSEGRLYGIVILAFDITEQVNAETHRREFTANVSHELKTPLQTIIGSAELMENGIVKDEDVPRFVGHIRKEAVRLVDLINDIIRLSQLDEGTEMLYEAVSLHAIAEEVCETLAEAAKMKDISLEVTGDDGVIYGVRRLLYDVIYNLCDNAIKYNTPGGYAKISIIEQQGAVQLTVSDNGIGISPEHHGKVFERFYRVDKSHSRQSGGTGLGLSIVKHAVQYHHGKIALESEGNKGTSISVQFDKNTPAIQKKS